MEDVKKHYAPYKGTGGFSREQEERFYKPPANLLEGCEGFLPPTPALQKQEGGSHYKDMAIQPVEYIYANQIGYFEGNVIKYVSRWKKKNGVADLLKAKHYIDLLIDLESK